MTNADSLLSVSGLSVFYDSIKAVDNVSFDVARGEIVVVDEDYAVRITEIVDGDEDLPQ